MSETIPLTCFGCGKKLKGRAAVRGRYTRCPNCGEIFHVLEDDHPKRQVEIWFSKKQRYSYTTIDRVIHFMNQARKSLDVAMYSLTHDWLLPVFKQAHVRGVKVRILVDKQQAGGKESDAAEYRKMGIEVTEDRESGLMHHKFAIRDRKSVLTGSYNWTKGAEEKNRENFMILHYPHVVDKFTQEFETLWAENRDGILPPPEPDGVSEPVETLVGE